jgi:hypothetical protein
MMHLPDVRMSRIEKLLLTNILRDSDSAFELLNWFGDSSVNACECE